MQTLEAKGIDETHLELSTSSHLPKGAMVMAYVVSDTDDAKEHDMWVSMGMRRFSEAYGSNEPEYPVSSVKTATI